VKRSWIAFIRPELPPQETRPNSGFTFFMEVKMSKPKHFVIASLLGLILVIMLPTCGIRTNPVLTSIPPPVGTLAILTPTQTTHTATPPPATSALSAFPDTSAFERLPFSFQDRALPSPDGHLIATTQTLNLVVYDLQGNLIGHSAAPN
jgi:hypothetical protein